MNSVSFKFVVMSLAFTAQVMPIAQAQAPSGLSEVALSRVDLGDFKIDTTEVSIGRFAEYASRKNLVTAAEREGGGFEYVMGWQRRPGWTWRTPFGQPAQPSEPAVHLNWAEAQGFVKMQAGAYRPERSGNAPPTPSNARNLPCRLKKAKLTPTQPVTNLTAPTLRVLQTVGHATRRSVKPAKASTVCMTWVPTCGSGWTMRKTVRD
jgi:hypothetical protein